MGSHSVICHPTEVTATPTGQVGTRFIDPVSKQASNFIRQNNEKIQMIFIRKDERLSWPCWLVTYRVRLLGLPIPVLTGSDVAQLR